MNMSFKYIKKYFSNIYYLIIMFLEKGLYSTSTSYDILFPRD